MNRPRQESDSNSSWADTWRDLIVPLLAPSRSADNASPAWSDDAGVGAYRRPRNDVPWRWAG